MSHLLAAISSHGFGHLAQAAPVLNALRRRLPSLQLTLRTTLPSALLKQRIEGEFMLQSATDDFGMVQHNALEVDIPASLQRYRELHANWQGEVERVAAELVELRPDLVFADVPYLTLAAAHRAGIPSVAMCSLNWHAILSGYRRSGDDMEGVLQQMLQAYSSADAFLCPAPSMPMPGFSNLREIGVVACPAENRRDTLVARGVIKADERLVLVAMGGIDNPLPLERWPVLEGTRYVVPAAWQVARSDCLAIEHCGLGFSELLASSSLVITKPGYGTFTEAAVNAKPVLFVRRGDWPEEAALVDWLQKHGICSEVSREQLAHGEIEVPIRCLLSQSSHPPVQADGVAQAADLLFAYLEGVG